MSDTRDTADFAAIGLSGLCIFHCLALPALAAFAPILASVGEVEWVHRLFVVLAVPISLFAFRHTGKGHAKYLFGLMALLGLVLLSFGAFNEAFHDYETQFTVAGAILLMGAHFLKWRTFYGKKQAQV